MRLETRAERGRKRHRHLAAQGRRRPFRTDKATHALPGSSPGARERVRARGGRPGPTRSIGARLPGWRVEKRARPRRAGASRFCHSSKSWRCNVAPPPRRGAGQARPGSFQLSPRARPRVGVGPPRRHIAPAARPAARPTAAPSARPRSAWRASGFRAPARPPGSADSAAPRIPAPASSPPGAPRSSA